jgi:hypothetical protein
VKKTAKKDAQTISPETWIQPVLVGLGINPWLFYLPVDFNVYAD